MLKSPFDALPLKSVACCITSNLLISLRFLAIASSLPALIFPLAHSASSGVKAGVCFKKLTKSLPS